MTDSLDTMNHRFGLTDALRFALGEGGMTMAEIQTPVASGRVALQGAHVLAWQPAGQQAVIWLSKAAVFKPGRPVRGGVPLCWPWFGPREGLPAHGFARTRLWQVRATRLSPTGEVVLHLGLTDDAHTRALWDFVFDLELVVTVGSSLSMALTTRNTGVHPFTITEALHTYFCVNSITKTQVQGLEDCHYLDRVVTHVAQGQQAGALAFSGETDRIYIDTTSDCVIDDRAASRRLRVAKLGSTSTVVWNPWFEREKALADMAPGEYEGMLCVETCNAGPDQITLAPGTAHTLSATISID